MEHSHWPARQTWFLHWRMQGRPCWSASRPTVRFDSRTDSMPRTRCDSHVQVQEGWLLRNQPWKTKRDSQVQHQAPRRADSYPRLLPRLHHPRSLHRRWGNRLACAPVHRRLRRREARSPYWGNLLGKTCQCSSTSCSSKCTNKCACRSTSRSSTCGWGRKRSVLNNKILKR